MSVPKKNDVDSMSNSSRTAPEPTEAVSHVNASAQQITYVNGMPFTESQLKAFLDFKLTPGTRAATTEEILAMLIK
jgi:hypothetical protein